MPNVLAILAVFGLLVWAIVAIRRRFAKPERRLMRDFKRLRKLILTGMDRSGKDEARRLLDGCRDHLEALLDAKEQHRLLGSMAGAAQELTGQPIEAMSQSAIDAFDRRLAGDLAEFFASMARISAVVGLHRDQALTSLRQFAEDLTIQRDALVELTMELHGGRQTLPPLGTQTANTTVKATVNQER
jgi:antitoxin component HigA of HigAB toxin-antitoxin module